MKQEEKSLKLQKAEEQVGIANARLAEATKSMIDVLPESDVKVIYLVAKNMFDKESSPFKALTREQILGDLAISRRQVENGECDDFDEFMDKIGADYGI